MAKVIRAQLEIDGRKGRASIKKTGRELKKLEKTGASAAKGLKVGFAAAAVAVVAISVAVKKTIADLDTMGKSAKKLGVGTDELQKLRFAAEQSGVDIGILESSMTALAKRVGEARAGTGALITYFKKHDIATLNLLKSTKSTTEAFEVMMDAIASTKNHMDKAAIASAAFSRAGVGLINMADDFRTLTKQAEELGIVIDKDTIKRAEEATDAFNILSKVIKANFVAAISDLIPLLTKMTMKLVENIKKIREFFGIVGFASEIIANMEKRMGRGMRPAEGAFWKSAVQVTAYGDALRSLDKELEEQRKKGIRGILKLMFLEKKRYTLYMKQLKERRKLPGLYEDVTREQAYFRKRIEPLGPEYKIEPLKIPPPVMEKLGEEYKIKPIDIEAYKATMESYRAMRMENTIEAIRLAGFQKDAEILALEDWYNAQKEVLGESMDLYMAYMGKKNEISEKYYAEEVERMGSWRDNFLFGVQQSIEAMESWNETMQTLGEQLHETFATEATANMWALFEGTKSAEQAMQDLGRAMVSWLGQAIIKELILIGLKKLFKKSEEMELATMSSKLALMATEIGVVGGLTAAYWALAAAKMAAGAGGGGGAAAGAAAGAMQSGGPVAGGQTYLVGEKGPELFTPASSGHITPNNQLIPNVEIQQGDIVNFVDPIILESYLSTPRGQKAILNVIGRNATTVQKRLMNG